MLRVYRMRHHIHNAKPSYEVLAHKKISSQYLYITQSSLQVLLLQQFIIPFCDHVYIFFLSCHDDSNAYAILITFFCFYRYAYILSRCTAFRRTAAMLTSTIPLPTLFVFLRLYIYDDHPYCRDAAPRNISVHFIRRISLLYVV